MRPRVVLAEDHELIAHMLHNLLSEECTVLATVGDGQSLVAVTRACQPDVIVTDIDMPTMTGIEAARSIFAEQPHARIIFVTAMDDPAIIRYALKLGALGYVLKSDIGELLDAVWSSLERRQFVSASGWNALGRALDQRTTWTDDAH